MTKPLISVVIAVRNEQSFIESCLDSFINQDIEKELFEIIIVDGRSDDNTKEIIQQFIQRVSSPRITLLHNPQKIQAAGWNIGFHHSKATYVVMMGGHTEVAVDFLRKNLEFHYAHKRIPCTGGMVKATGNDLKSEAIAAAFNSPLGAGNAKYWYGTQLEEVETVAFGMYKRSVLEKAGYIDENIIRGQDWELNYRITKQFGKMLFSPDIKSYYSSRSNFWQLWKRQFQAGLWKVYIFKKHPDSVLLRHVIPMIFSFIFLLLAGVGLFYRRWRPFFLFITLYGLVNLFYSIKAAIGQKRISTIPYLMYAYFIIHFAYGFGILTGIFKFALSRKKTRKDSAKKVRQNRNTKT